MHPSTGALFASAVAFVAAAAGPQRSAVTTDAKLELGLIAFGGIYRWQAGRAKMGADRKHGLARRERPSNFTGGGTVAVSSQIIYEPF